MSYDKIYLIKGSNCDCQLGENCTCRDWDVASYKNEELANTHAKLAQKKSKELELLYNNIDKNLTKKQKENYFDNSHVERFWGEAFWYYVEDIIFYEQVPKEGGAQA